MVESFADITIYGIENEIYSSIKYEEKPRLSS